MLIHPTPPKPGYFRAKVGRRLPRAGAVAIKSPVYVLPTMAICSTSARGEPVVLGTVPAAPGAMRRRR